MSEDGPSVSAKGIREVVLRDTFRKFEIAAESRIASLRAAANSEADVLSLISESYRSAIWVLSQFALYASEDLVFMLIKWRKRKLEEMRKADANLGDLEIAMDCVYMEAIMAVVGDSESNDYILDLVEEEGRKFLVNLLKRSSKSKGTLPALSTCRFVTGNLNKRVTIQDHQLRLQSLLMGKISEYRPSAVHKLFLSADKQSPFTFELLRFFKLSITDPNTIELSWTVVQSFLDEFLRPQGKAYLKQCIIRSLTSILSNVSCSQVFSKWTLQMEKLYDRMKHWSLKPRNFSIGVPFLSCVSRLCSDEFFVEKFTTELVSHIKSLAVDKKTRLIGLSCFFHLLSDRKIQKETKWAKSLSDTVVHKFLFLSMTKNVKDRNVFHLETNTESLLAEQDVLVAILLQMALIEPSHLLAEYLPNLLGSKISDPLNPKSDEYMPILCALHCLIGILGLGDCGVQVFSSRFAKDCHQFEGPSISSAIWKTSQLFVEASIAVKPLLIPFGSQISESLFAIDCIIMQTIGPHLVTGKRDGKINEQKTSNSHDILTSIHQGLLATHAFMCESSEFSRVSRSLIYGLIHQCKQTREVAKSTIEELKRKRPSLLPTLALEVSLIVLRTSFFDIFIVETLLGCLEDLIKSILQHHAWNEIQVRDIFLRSAVEAAGLFWMTCSYTVIRKASMAVLEAISSQEGSLLQTMDRYQEQITYSLKTRSLPELIVESSDHENEDLYQEDIQVEDIQENGIRRTFFEISSSPKDTCWSILFQELLRTLISLPSFKETIRLLNQESSSRFRIILDMFNKSANCSSKRCLYKASQLYMFRNILGLTVICSSINVENHPEKVVAIVKELCHCLSKARHPNVSNSIVSSLGGCHWTAIDYIHRELFPIFEHACDGLQKKHPTVDTEKNELSILQNKQKQRRIILQNSSLVYRQLAEGIRAEILQANADVLLSFLSFLERMKSVLESTSFKQEAFFLGRIDRNKIEILNSWLNFVLVIKRITVETSIEPFSQPLEVHVRRSLFVVLHRFYSYCSDCLKEMGDSGAPSPLFALGAMKRKHVEKYERKRQLFKKLLSEACFAMATVVSGELFCTSPSEIDSQLFKWIDWCLIGGHSSLVRKSGLLALSNCLSWNPDLLLPLVVKKIYDFSVRKAIRRKYFLALGDTWILKKVQIDPANLICLILLHVSDDYQEVRSLCLDMIPILIERRPVDNKDVPFIVPVTISSLCSSRLDFLQHISSMLASRYGSRLAEEVLINFWSKIKNCDGVTRLGLVRSCIPWLKAIDLTLLSDPKQLLVLLLQLTEEIIPIYPAEVERLWFGVLMNTSTHLHNYQTTAQSSSGSREELSLKVVLGFLLTEALDKQNLKQLTVTLSTYQEVVVFICKFNPKMCIHLLSEEIRRSSTFISMNSSKAAQKIEVDTVSLSSDLESVFSFQKSPDVSKVYLLITFASQLAFLAKEFLLDPETVSCALHLGLIGLKHSNIQIQKECRNFVVYFVQTLTFDLENNMIKVGNFDCFEIAKKCIDLLMKSTDEEFVSFRKSEKRYRQFCYNIVSSVLGILQLIQPDIQLVPYLNNLKDNAVKWMLSCKDSYLCSGSHQLYQCVILLNESLGNKLVIFEIVVQLLDSLKEGDWRIMCETLNTFRFILEHSTIESADHLSCLPEVFWISVQSLATVGVSNDVLSSSLQFISEFFTSMPFDDPGVYTSIMSASPLDLRQHFFGIQPILLALLKYQNLRYSVMELFFSMLFYGPNELVDVAAGRRYLRSILVQIPWLALCGPSDETIVYAAKNIIKLCNQCLMIPELGSVFNDFIELKYVDPLSFLHEIAGLMANWMQSNNQVDEIFALIHFIKDGCKTDVIISIVLHLIKFILEAFQWNDPSMSRFLNDGCSFFMTLAEFFGLNSWDSVVIDIFHLVLERTQLKSGSYFFDFTNLEKFSNIEARRSIMNDLEIGPSMMEVDLQTIRRRRDSLKYVSNENLKNETFAGTWAKNRRTGYTDHYKSLAQITGVRPGLFKERGSYEIMNSKLELFPERQRSRPQLDLNSIDMNRDRNSILPTGTDSRGIGYSQPIADAPNEKFIHPSDHQVRRTDSIRKTVRLNQRVSMEGSISFDETLKVEKLGKTSKISPLTAVNEILTSDSAGNAQCMDDSRIGIRNAVRNGLQHDSAIDLQKRSQSTPRLSAVSSKLSKLGEIFSRLKK